MRIDIKIFLITFILLIASACSQNQSIKEPTPNIESTQIQAIKQVYQVLELSFNNTPTPTISKPSPTNTIAPKVSQKTQTRIVTKNTNKTNPTEIPKVTNLDCVNHAEFVKILNLGDYTQLKTGEAFAKIWRIKNSGTCTWTTTYKLIFSEGSQMSCPNEVPLPHDVLPGETIDLRVNGFAPIVPDQYFSDWLFQDEIGNLFGIGDTVTEPLTIIIIVNQYTEIYDPDPGPI